MAFFEEISGLQEEISFIFHCLFWIVYWNIRCASATHTLYTGQLSQYNRQYNNVCSRSIWSPIRAALIFPSLWTCLETQELPNQTNQKGILTFLLIKIYRGLKIGLNFFLCILTVKGLFQRILSPHIATWLCVCLSVAFQDQKLDTKCDNYEYLCGHSVLQVDLRLLLFPLWPF